MIPETDANETTDILRVVVPAEYEGERLDKTMAKLCPDYSRSRLQGLIAAGELYVNGQVCTIPSTKMEEGDSLFISLPEIEDAIPLPENIPLDIVYEDSDVIVLNKAAGMVVHPAVGNPSGTLVNALLYHCGDTLSGINGVRRPGIVHRLDKDTTGLMIVAKNDSAHHKLTEQLQDRSLSRVYLCVVSGVPKIAKGSVETQIGRHPRNRLKMAVLPHGGRDAMTHYEVMQNFHDTLALVECRLATGRTHQIRVHMEHLGYPLVGDPLYGPQPTMVKPKLKKNGFTPETIDLVLDFPRQALHAAKLAFIHPGTGKIMEFQTRYPDDLSLLINEIEK
jgi:23S rRNA pseudouridine1911/1915/1917 synthase